jgi:hypothetical protein
MGAAAPQEALMREEVITALQARARTDRSQTATQDAEWVTRMLDTMTTTLQSGHPDARRRANLILSALIAAPDGIPMDARSSRGCGMRHRSR